MLCYELCCELCVLCYGLCCAMSCAVVCAVLFAVRVVLWQARMICVDKDVSLTMSGHGDLMEAQDGLIGHSFSFALSHLFSLFSFPFSLRFVSFLLSASLPFLYVWGCIHRELRTFLPRM